MRKWIINGFLSLSLVSSMGIANLSAQEAGKISIADGTLVLEAPADWKKVEPKFSITQYEFRAPKDGKEGEQARVTVTASSGSIEENVTRWKNQFDGLKDSDASVTTKEIAGSKVHMVDIKGTYKDSMGGPFAGGPVKKLPDYRLLGLIIESKKSGLIFFKMTGPKDVVEKQQEAWLKMAESMKNGK